MAKLERRRRALKTVFESYELVFENTVDAVFKLKAGVSLDLKKTEFEGSVGATSQTVMAVVYETLFGDEEKRAKIFSVDNLL